MPVTVTLTDHGLEQEGKAWLRARLKEELAFT